MDVCFEKDEPPGCTIVAKKVAQSCYTQADKVILEFERPDKTTGQINTPIEGVVHFKRDIRKGFSLTPGMIVATIEVCDHSMVIKNLCATCGKDLLKTGDEDGAVVSSSASISMIHNVPELIVSDKLAQEIGTEDREHVIGGRRLILLVDLDQTIIHTTNKPHGSDVQNNPDIVAFQLYGGTHYTKLRPYTRNFIENMSKLYQMHIVTYGQRQYAHKIASIVDPDGRYFSHRILSRDELFSPVLKSTNLEAIFPCDELRSMIAIIDDRADVWQFSEALIQVKPYRYFKEVGDINAAASGHSGEPVADLAINDDDHVLEYMEKVLTQIHSAFYRNFDEKNGEIKDLKVIIKYLKAQVLRNSVIVLSGVVPLEMKERKEEHRSEVYRLCEQFGAKVVDEMSPEVTHLIAVQWGTKKVHEARRLKIPIVTPGWLYACVERWIKVDEKQYELTDETVVPNRGEGSGRTLVKKMVFDPSVVHTTTLGIEKFDEMVEEVDEELSGDDDDSDDNAASEENEDDKDLDSNTNTKDVVEDGPEEVPETSTTAQPSPRKRTREELDRGWSENDDPYEDDSKRRNIDGDDELDDEEDPPEIDDYPEPENQDSRSGDGDNDDDADGVREDDSDLDEMADELEHELEE